jgi:hypothetical protein
MYATEIDFGGILVIELSVGSSTANFWFGKYLLISRPVRWIYARSTVV